MLACVVFVPTTVLAQDVIEYYGVDAIGSVRVVFDAAGLVTSRMDYGPFGEQLAPSTTGAKSYAQLFRDGETGQDYAQARMYQLRTGRFSASDPVFGTLFNPQTWNRYTYALNDPLAFVDPTGLMASSCVMKEIKLNDNTVTMAEYCNVTGGGGGTPSLWGVSLFIDGINFQRGTGSGRDALGGGRGRGNGPLGTSGSPSDPVSNPSTPPVTTSPPSDPGDVSACEAFSGQLVELAGVARSSTGVTTLGASLMILGYSDVSRGRSVSGFKPALTNNQGSDVYRHVQFAAGASLLRGFGIPGGRAAFNLLVQSDLEQLGIPGHPSAVNELADDYAGAEVGYAMRDAIVTGNYAQLRTRITKTLCEK